MLSALLLLVLLQSGREPCRFNRQWLRPAPSSALAPARRAVAPVSGLAGSGTRLCMAVARDWHVTLVSSDYDTFVICLLLVSDLAGSSTCSCIRVAGDWHVT